MVLAANQSQFVDCVRSQKIRLSSRVCVTVRAEWNEFDNKKQDRDRDPRNFLTPRSEPLALSGTRLDTNLDFVIVSSCLRTSILYF